MFGRRLSEYFAFQKVFLALIVAVGLARLALSLAGLPNAGVSWLSMTVVAFAGALYAGVAVHTRGFGSYKQLLPLVFLQTTLVHAIAVVGIVLSIAGLPNIFAAPEFSGPAGGTQSQWTHALAHLTIGMVAFPLVLWGVASLVMLITKRVARRPVTA